MALYVSITLLAALTVTDKKGADHADVLDVVWGTTIGLALAHWCAFGLAARLVGPTNEHVSRDRQLVAHLTGACSVAVLATIPVFLFPNDLEWGAARFTVATAIGLVAFFQMRALGAPRPKALRIAVVALLLAETVAFVKRSLGH
jgi:hypothetical protein